jgi:predicted kinase
MKPVIYVLRGLSGAGKTTAAFAAMRRHGGKIVRVNRDSLRGMAGMQWSRESDELVNAARDAFVIQAIDRGYSVISDDTNLGRHEIARWQSFGATFGASVTYQWVPTHVSECIRRDLMRDVGQVGQAVIEKQCWIAIASSDGSFPAEIVKDYVLDEANRPPARPTFPAEEVFPFDPTDLLAKAVESAFDSERNPFSAIQ